MPKCFVNRNMRLPLVLLITLPSVSLAKEWNLLRNEVAAKRRHQKHIKEGKKEKHVVAWREDQIDEDATVYAASMAALVSKNLSREALTGEDTRVVMSRMGEQRWKPAYGVPRTREEEERQSEEMGDLSAKYCTGRRRSRDVIVYLGQKTHSSYDATHKNTLNASMESLRNNMHKIGESDVIVWHEGDLSPADATALNGVTNVRFCLLTSETGWGPPPWLPVIPKMKFSAGYRFMIRFYAITIWRTLQRLGYEWVMRMDDDSFITSPVDYNIFDDMRKNRLFYGYRMLSSECPTIFGDFVDTYAQHAHWLRPESGGTQVSRLDYGPQGLHGLASYFSSSSQTKDKRPEVMATPTTTAAKHKQDKDMRRTTTDDDAPTESGELDAESKHIISFCGTWPRHCRKAEMQKALAEALRKAHLFVNGGEAAPDDVISRKQYMSWYCAGPGQLGFYNNWFVTHIDWWIHTPAVNRFIAAFDRSNLIFSRRCNDLIFQTAAIKLYMAKAKRKRYTDFTYQHHTVSNGLVTFGGIETGHEDPAPEMRLRLYRDKFVPANSHDYVKVRTCEVQATLDEPFHTIYYISPAADRQKHESDTFATNTVINRFESPYCGPENKTPLE